MVRGKEAEFEQAFRRALPLIEATPGFLGLTLSRGIETPSTYLLLVEWESVQAHEVGFRGSDRYPKWQALLHHFYDPFPVVEHFADVASTDERERLIPGRTRWRSGDELPSPAKARELIDLDHIMARARMLWEPEVVQDWLQGPNAYLDGARPIDVLRVRGSAEVLQALDAAAASGAFA